MEEKDTKLATVDDEESVDDLPKDVPEKPQQSRKLELDTGEEHLNYRRKWWQLW